MEQTVPQPGFLPAWVPTAAVLLLAVVAAADEQAGGDAALKTPGIQVTDCATALEKVLADVPGDRLAGVLVLTDGRHNARPSVDAVARRLGAQKVPVCSVIVGSTTPPPDAVITRVVAPHSICVEDKLVIEAGVKFDGLRGKEAHVKLVRDGKTIDERTVTPPTSHFRTLVALTDTPKEKGIHTYQVEVPAFEGETFVANNMRAVHVAVTDDLTKLLLIEGRPRWEFRYLRNLFADRDKSVRLRYVLFHADTVLDQPKRPPVYASVASKEGSPEATALPENEQEWFNFDVIVLGDVPPDSLTEEHVKTIEKFVAERGGTLVVVAGPQYMPHAFGGSRLLDLLPCNVEPSKDPVVTGPEPRFRVALTDAGRDHVLLRQSDQAEDSQRIWRSLPDADWRHPVKDTKPGAVVLAYAVPEKPADTPVPEGSAGQQTEQAMHLRREFERKNALVALQRFGLGQVLMLSFDRTWRFRYQVGDAYHHKFWGQVLRWATAGKLQAGTEFVRLGTDRMLYATDEPVRVRAKITNENHQPVAAADAAVCVYDGARLVLRKKLDRVPDSAGFYEADLGALSAAGRYRVELESAEAARVLASGDLKKVETEILVTSTQSAELSELSADRGVVERIARLTGGAVAEPAKAAELLPLFGPGVGKVVDKRQFALWNSWPLLAIMVVVAAAEWIVRKKEGLI